MFKIDTFTAAKIRTLTKRMESHGDERVNAWTMGLEITGPNTMLDVIDPEIRHALYKPVDGQDQLPGVEPATPVLRCNHFDRHTLTTKHEGWVLSVDDSIDASDPTTIGGVKVDKLVVEAKQGGSIVLRLSVGTSDWDPLVWAWLCERHEEQVWLTLLPPLPTVDAIDGSTEAFERDHPDAGSLFVDAHGGQDPDEDDGSGHTDGETSKATLDASGNNPFATGAAADAPDADPKPRGRRRAAAQVE